MSLDADADGERLLSKGDRHVCLVVGSNVVSNSDGGDGDQALASTSALKESTAKCYYPQLKELNL